MYNINMGNNITKETVTEMEHVIKNITSYDCPTIDIGNNMGHSGYIDFIDPSYTNDNEIVKGIDVYNRQFIVIKASYILNDGNCEHLFSTFFNRYNDNSILWHCCGHYGQYMMHTDGGMCVDQLTFLNKLLQTKEIILTDELINKCRLNLKSTEKNMINSIVVGWR